ncbi:general transcription factor 3C polypeptide 4 isoform X1 [Nothobranchius furzeri]|uniref:Ral transcription factor IIIC subunit 4 n=2 Tax=Nothobranchius furzeri TaxID=105023 RepID=A0A1A8AC22_NOTFU|nr:general transcription factor 3C polypeptide 4 [Nothobranchius furzeri]KAF7217771.1 general transcription factor IIIC subunit 4 [Nothobranchius furzeri]
MAAAGACESAPNNNNINKTKPEREDTVTLSGSRDVPVGRDPVVSLLSPVSGLQPLSWSEDHRLAVGTCGSLTLLELLCDIHSNKQELTLHRTSIPVPTEAHRIRVGSPAEVAEAMEKFSTHPDPTVRQEFLADAVINPSVGARTGVKYSSWSPIGCDSTGCCLLACLTLDNRLTVHRSHKHLEWTTMVDVSKKYSERLKERGYAKKDNKPPEANLLDFDELQRRFRMQTPLRMEWSSVYSMTHVQQDNSCVNVDMVLLAVLMENGDLVLWKFSLPFTKGEDVEFYDLVESGVTRPSDLAWWEYENEDRRMSGLIIGSEVGPVKIMPVNLSKVKGYFTVRQPIVLWKECDEIPVENIKCVPLIHPIHKTSCSLIVASRGCYIFWSLLMISPAGLNVHNSHLAGLNSLPVVSLTVSRHSGTFYTCSTDGWVTKLTPKFTESSLVFTVDKLLQPEALTGSRIHGISVSHNGAYFALVGTQGLVGAFHPIRRTYKVHFLALKAPETAAVELLNSPTQNLYRGMDLLDLVRWNVLKNKCIPTQLQEELDRKIQELDTPYLWRLKLFLWRILHQSLHTPRVNHNWRPTPAEAVIVGPEAAEKEGELGKVKRKKEEERRAEVQSLIRTMETHLMRANIKKVLGVVYLNTWIAKNISIPTCGLMDYLSKDPNDRDSEVLIHHIRNKMNKQMFLERCSLCQAVLPFTDHKRAICENGHMWHRCVLSYQACQTMTFRSCLLHDSIARLPEPEDPDWIKKILQAPCSLCDSPLI